MLSNLRHAITTVSLRFEGTPRQNATHASSAKPDSTAPSVAESREARSAAPPKGVTVNLSAPGLMKSAQQQNDHPDIDESGLPEPVKNLLKQLRELKKQLAEKQRELQEALADPQLSDEARADKVQALQSEISALNTALIAANHSLRELIKATDMTDEQVSKTLMLSIK